MSEQAPIYNYRRAKSPRAFERRSNKWQSRNKWIIAKTQYNYSSPFHDSQRKIEWLRKFYLHHCNIQYGTQEKEKIGLTDNIIM